MATPVEREAGDAVGHQSLGQEARWPHVEVVAVAVKEHGGRADRAAFGRVENSVQRIGVGFNRYQFEDHGLAFVMLPTWSSYRTACISRGNTAHGVRNSAHPCLERLL